MQFCVRPSFFRIGKGIVMSIVRTKELVFEYIRRDEEGNVEGINTAIDHVNLKIAEGSFIAILGHNGSGKSTLAKHINALLTPTEGAVVFDNMDTSEEENLWNIRQKAGMVFQNPENQIIGTVVDEDVAFGPENLGVPSEEIWDRVTKALEDVGMTAYRDYSPSKLSGGQKQRVAIAGVMAMHPKCIIMDEPTAMLDPNGRREVLQAVKELNEKEKITVILITHNMDEAVLADKVFVMDKGKIVMEGTSREIFSNVEKLKEIRLDVPDVTEMAYLLSKAGLPIRKDILTRAELVNELSR